MGNWTYTSNFNLLPNIDVRSVFCDGILKRYDLYPCEGYVLWLPSGDNYEYDDEGNLILDENGNPILINHYYMRGGATVQLNYDFTTNPEGYQAVLYEEGMIVYGGTTPPTETE